MDTMRLLLGCFGGAAVEIKKKAIERGVIEEDSYLLPKDKLVARIELQGYKDNVFIQVGSYIKKERHFSSRTTSRTWL